MKIRESGMPEHELWESFFDPQRILAALKMSSHTRDVAEFGCGYGTFTLPAAKIISGEVYTFDIDPEMVRVTTAAAGKQGIHTVHAVLRDFMAEGTGLKDQSVDYAMLFNILHLENPVALLREANRVLNPGGTVGIIHWNYDPATPRGPSLAIRPKPEQCLEWAKTAGFVAPQQFDFKPYHYGIVMTK